MLSAEIRQGVRALLRVPSLTVISVLTVALGVGAGTALFSVVKAVLLNPLPYPQPDRLAWIAEMNDKGGDRQVAYQNYLDWAEQNHTFAQLAAFSDFPAIVSGADVPRSTHVAAVSQDFFDVMGVQARTGRTFMAAEQAIGGPPVAVISDGLWQRAFGGNPGVIGRTLRIAGVAPTIIGIMPPGFAWPEKAEVWLPITAFGDPGFKVRTGHNYRVVGRLRDGALMSTAKAEISGIQQRLKREYPSPFQSKDVGVVALQTHVAGEVRPAILMLFGAVGFLLLIVCVNVANLLLVRVTGRSRELSVRTALGASRWRLVRQMLTESLLLAVGGGIAGLLLAVWSMDLLRVLLPPEVPRLNEIQIDGGVIGFALAVSGIAGLLFGFFPAWRACAMNINDALKSGSRSATAGRASSRTQAALVVSEVCLSLVLVAGAGLLARSFWHLRSIDPGFRSDHVLVSDAPFPNEPLPKLISRYPELLSRIRAIPGVVAAGTATTLPIDGFHPDGHFYIEGRMEQTKSADADWSAVSPGYLSALRIPILRGRDFTEADAASRQPVMIINQEMARVYFPGADPIGQRIWFNSFTPQESWATIIGITGDVRQESLTQKSAFPGAYVLYAHQTFVPALSDGFVVVRTAVDPAGVAGAVRTAIRAVNPDSAPTTRTLVAVLAESLARQRFQMQILGTFAILALVLAAVGLYGVLSYMVTATRSQIGIRLALGAQPSSVFGMITLRALALAGVGIVLGGLGCLAVRRVIAAMLFGVGPTDPVTIAAAIVVLLAVTVAAAFFPARRAMKTDPIVALRDE